MLYGKHWDLKDDLTKIVGIEVKKLQRDKTQKIARSSGLDYNTTPPCGTIRIYDSEGIPLYVRGFYLFVCQETTNTGDFYLSAMAFCDGNVLNDDIDYYLSITSQREKEVGLGTYGDGANRNRPMLIFANPLGAKELDNSSSLIGNLPVDQRITPVYRLIRTTISGEKKEFFVYRSSNDVGPGWEIKE